MSRLTARTENGNAYLVNVKPDEQEVDSPHKNTLQCIMRMIDKDALLSDIERAIEKSGCVNHEGEIMDCVRYAPIIDAVPVVRGEWVVDECDTTDDVPSFSWIDFHCSECNTDYGLEEGQYGWCRYEKIPYQYCPNCGAKMEVTP